jgi:signal transduction histidine kinase
VSALPHDPARSGPHPGLRYRLVSVTPGIIAAGLGIAAMIGWYTGTAALLRLRPDHSPIEFNSGLCFVLAGTGLLLDVLGWTTMAAALGTLVTVTAAAALGQHGIGLDLGIATVLYEEPVEALGAASTTLMAVNTAVCFGLAGLGLVLLGRRPALARLLGATVVVLGGVAFAGYFARIPEAFTWGGGKPMSLYSAAGFLVLGTGLAAGPGTGTADERTLWWTPYATAIMSIGASLLFWRALVTHEHANLTRMARLAAANSETEISSHVKALAAELALLASDVSGDDPLADAQEWRRDVRIVLGHFAGVIAIDWVDANLDVRDSTRPGRAGLPHREAFERARVIRGAAVGPPFRLPGGDVAFQLAVPVLRGGEVAGFCGALLNAAQFFAKDLAIEGHEYDVLLTSDGDLVLWHERGVASPSSAWRQERTIALPGGAAWTLSLAPSRTFARTVSTALPEVVLTAGILLSLFLAATLRLNQVATERARELADANQQLGVEVEQRRRVEEEQRALARDLEQRVRGRTAELTGANAALSLENALRQAAQANLARSNQDLREFAAFVSHELRQPLSALGIWAELLESTCSAAVGDKGRTYLAKIRAAVNRMARLIEGELALSQVAFADVATDEMPLEPLVAEVVSELRPQLDQIGARIEVGELPTLRADPRQIRQMVTNLLENAIKYRRPNVPLVVAIDGEVRVDDGQARCEIRVRDNGRGFASEDAGDIFAIFRRVADDDTHGTGVGLAVCRRIAERHGGSISAEGRPGEGATFRIVLPAAT